MCSEGRYILSPTTKCTERQYVPSHLPLQKSVALHLNKLESPCFVPSLVEIGPMILEEKMNMWKVNRWMMDNRHSEKLTWTICLWRFFLDKVLVHHASFFSCYFFLPIKTIYSYLIKTMEMVNTCSSNWKIQ